VAVDTTVVAVVTGGGSGIGRASALRLGEQGFAVAVVDRDEPAASDTVRAIEAAGGRAAAFGVDVTDRPAVAALPGQVEGSLGVATVLVNNAGFDVVQPFLENEPEFWDRLVEVNFLGTVRVTRAFLDGMIDRGTGRVVNVASDAGRVGSSGETVYAGTKGGVIAFTKSLAREMARYQITVNCVCPGPTDTPLFRAQPPRIQVALERAIPFRRLARPEEVAEAVAFFCSERCSYVTGQVLSVSGGLTMVG
jgi:2-hydroxycyclohexanecarboxyl-CoA dehydrogenase